MPLALPLLQQAGTSTSAVMQRAGLALAIVSLSWAVVFDLTPERLRPQAGSSRSGSMIELIVGHNGVERFVRNRPDARPTTVAAPAQIPTFRAPASHPVPARWGGRVETDEGSRLTVSARASVGCRRRPRGARR